MNHQSLPSQRVAFAASLALALAGLVLSIMLVRVHHDAASGLTSFCTISEEVNCDKVALSRWSSLFGVPVAVWGVAGYGLVGALAVWGLSAGRLHSRWPAGLLLASGLAFSAVSLGLAFISKAIIGAWCLLCVGSWVTSLGLLVTGWLACRPGGVAAAVRADLQAVRKYPRRAAALALAGAGGVLLLIGRVSPGRGEGRRWAAGPAVPEATRRRCHHHRPPPGDRRCSSVTTCVQAALWPTSSSGSFGEVVRTSRSFTAIFRSTRCATPH